MNNFDQRLLSARKMAGLSLQELADRMDMDITKQALSQYEKGKINPTSSAIIALSNVLDLPADYFFRESEEKFENLEFRKRSRLPRKEIEAVKYKTLNYLEKNREIEDLLNIENIFTNPLNETFITCEDDIEKCADELRNVWNLGLDPIPDVIALLEEKKIKVFEIIAPDEFSGLSSWTDGVAVIVVNKDLHLTRKRFTLLHELAHLILDFSVDMGDKEREHFCFSFAGAFLFPEKIFIEELGKKRRGIFLKELILLENHYGISVQAIMWRTKSLGLISESKFKEYNIWLNKSNNKKTEFGDFQGREVPERFERLVYKALSEDIITSSKAAALLNKALPELEEELFRII
jgi:Zn-dependent peptidase ImmA (M78 family)/DNA-binding XRE family transcriptional regulator